ncbi:mitochondrial outer membrane protein porin 6-like [Curcuma longa]|uniref:mitochondrial outer membrane protein porin 6-like n=1 Tax=Curcuma longa TaxID=136217 RepID=UPI003D9F0740
MAVGPALFSEIGKRAKASGLTATGIKVNEQFLGDISTQCRNGKTLIDVKVDTNSNVSTTTTVDELLAGAKTKLSFKLPDQKSGKILNVPIWRSFEIGVATETFVALRML